jgi:CRISPR-associated endoribonuclease Cas6
MEKGYKTGDLPNYRVKLVLENAKKELLPYDYRRQVRGLIFNLIRNVDPDLYRDLCEEGYGLQKYKLFTYSLRPDEGVYNEKGFASLNGLYFLRFASADGACLEAVEKAVFALNTVSLNSRVFEILEVSRERLKERGGAFRILSPVVVAARSGKKYLSLPEDEKDFLRAVKDATKKRYELRMKKKGDIEVSFLNSRRRLVQYKDGNILCFGGRVLIEADPEMIRFVQCCGLGQKSGIGMGMIA